MADYTVGGDLVEYAAYLLGDYSAAGTYGGKPYYTNGSAFLWWEYIGGTVWVLGSEVGGMWDSEGGSSAGPESSNGAWSEVGPFGTPVVTALGGATTHYGNLACDTVCDFQGVGTLIEGGDTVYGNLAADTVAAFVGQGYGIFVGNLAADTVAAFACSASKYNADDRGANLTDDTWDDLDDTTAHMGTALDNLGYFIRFPISVPVGSTILTAVLTLEAALSQTGTATLRATLLNYDNCGQFTESNFAAPSNVSLTATYVEWVPVAWVADTRYDLDVKTLIQAFVNRAGYASGQYAGILIATGGE
jgi:hypothetical protein